MASQRWQIPSFVPAQELRNTPVMLLSSTLGFSAILGSLNLSQFVEAKNHDKVLRKVMVKQS
jgi:hypothetical protein